ncbi:MAG: TonB-dependent receptor, partial [Calditrichaceae bacterium]
IETNDSTVNGGFKSDDWGPSGNLIFALISNMNIRLAYSQTLARPTFREIGEFSTFDFTGGEVYIGNRNLKRTFIKNYDMRWEWFSRPGEIYAVSLFYKDFSQPIERVYNLFGENTWNNIDEAKAYGMELEFRKRLDIIHSSLSHFLLGSNLSLIHSEVNIPYDEWQLIKDIRPEADRKRPFQGQSPYLVNANLTYENPELGVVSTLYYNIFGERLDRVSYAATPDIYEKPAGLLNFSFKYAFTEKIDLKFAANNLLNPNYTKYHSYKDKEYIYSQYKKGISYSLGLGYNF